MSTFDGTVTRGDARLSGTWAVSSVVLAVGALAVCSIVWIYGHDLTRDKPIRSDAIGYYAYLPALFIDRDLTFTTMVASQLDGRAPSAVGIQTISDDTSGRHYVNKYPVGEAVMLLPFFALGHAAALVGGAEADGYSRPYQFAAVLGALVYALLGLLVLGRVLLRSFSSRSVAIALIALTFGSSLFNYITFDAVYSHAFSFFLVALIMRLSIGLLERGAGTASTIALGATIGLLTTVRVTNVAAVVLPALIGTCTWADVRGRAAGVVRRPYRLGAGVVAFLVVLAPQFAYMKVASGSFFFYSYGNEHLELLHPQLLNVLFSVRKGLFFWAPVLVFAVIGVVLLRRTSPAWFLPATTFLVLTTWLVASWETWWYGDSFGQRAFVDGLPVVALGLCSFLESARNTRVTVLAFVCVFAATALTVSTMIGYWKGWIPMDRTNWGTYLDSFGSLWRSLPIGSARR